MFQAELLADNIKKLRGKAGMTQQELADKLYLSGQAISKWESGQSLPDLANLTALADIFSVSVDTLIGHIHADRRVFLGIDGGATKTEFVLVDESGMVLGRLLKEGCNPNACGLETTCSVLRTGIDEFLLQYPQITGVFAGIAGALSGDHLTGITDFLKSTYPLLRFSVSSDISNVIAGAGELDRCAAMICGTGCVIYASIDGKLHRVGGWGYLLDDASGGYSLGRAALRAALAEEDGFGDKTVITKLVHRKLGTDVWSSIHAVYAGGDSMIASFAPLILDAYQADDSVAKRILDDYTAVLAQQLRYTFSAYDCGNTLVLAGGLLQNDSLVTKLLQDKLPRSIRIIVPGTPPIYGACRRSCRFYGTLHPEFQENFTKTYQR